MADQTVVTGVQGGLPNLPRKALNNSVIAAEQAYRKRKGLPALSPEEIYCLKQGIPMPWEPGGTMPDPAAVAAELGEASAVAPAGSGQGGAGQAAQNAVPAGALPTQNAAPA